MHVAAIFFPLCDNLRRFTFVFFKFLKSNVFVLNPEFYVIHRYFKASICSQMKLKQWIIVETDVTYLNTLLKWSVLSNDWIKWSNCSKTMSSFLLRHIRLCMLFIRDIQWDEKSPCDKIA